MVIKHFQAEPVTAARIRTEYSVRAAAVQRPAKNKPQTGCYMQKGKIMNYRINKIIAGLLSLIILALTSPVVVAASEEGYSLGLYDKISISIPVEVEYSGKVIIKPMKKNYPMPAGNTLEVDKRAAFTIEYDEPEHFEYEIQQIPGDDKTVKYDKTVYKADVWIVTSEEGNALEPQVVIYRDGSNEKSASAKFVNIYPDPTPTPVPTATICPCPPGVPTGGQSTAIGAKGAPAPQTGDTYIPFMLAGMMAMGSLILFIRGKRVLVTERKK